MAILFFSVKVTLVWQDLLGAKIKSQLLLLVSRLRQKSSISSLGSAGSPSLALFLSSSEKWILSSHFGVWCLPFELPHLPFLSSKFFSSTFLRTSVVVCLLFSCVKGECS